VRYINTVMKFFSLFSFGLAAALFVSSCTKDSGISSQRETTFAYYKLVHNAALYSTVATVDFYDGSETGAKVDLGYSVKAKVTFNQAQAAYSPSTFTFYREYSNKQSSLLVRYNYVAGTIEYKNTLQLAKDITLPGNLTSIDKNVGATITFGGNAIATGESVTLTIGSLKFSNTVVGSNKFDLSPQDLASLAAGTVKVTIERHKITEASEGSAAGGKLEGVYISVPKNVTVH
jgi:hypothetical protein